MAVAFYLGVNGLRFVERFRRDDCNRLVRNTPTSLALAPHSTAWNRNSVAASIDGDERRMEQREVQGNAFVA